jgi:hypothetical protein
MRTARRRTSTAVFFSVHRRATIQIGRDAIMRAYEPFNLNPLWFEWPSFDVQRISESVALWVNILHMRNLLSNDFAVGALVTSAGLPLTAPWARLRTLGRYSFL